MKHLAIIRSEPLSPDRVRFCAKTLEDCYIHLRFRFWKPGEGSIPTFIANRLFDVADFGTVYAIDVWFHAIGFEESAKVDAIREILDTDSHVHWRELWRTYEKNRQVVADNNENRYELSIGCGRSHLGYYCCFDPLDYSPSFRDKSIRETQFRKAISSIGLQEEVCVFIDEHGDLRMTAQQPWKLSHFSAEISGANPSGFNLNGFHSAKEASRAAWVMLTELADSSGIGMIRANLPISTYSSIFPQLNQIGCGWRLYPTSNWDGPAARSLDDQDFLESKRTGRYPAFSWWEGKNGPEVIGSALVENGSCFLELATEGGGVELLEERAAVLETVAFHTVVS